MDSIEYTTTEDFGRVRVALKDRKSDLKRIGLNRLIAAIYNRKIDLCELMEELGIRKERIELLRLRYFPVIVDSVIAQIKNRVCLVDSGKRKFEIIERYFGLDGYMPARLSSLGTKYGISRERVRQIKERCLIQLRAKDTVTIIEDSIMLSAKQIGYLPGEINELIDEGRNIDGAQVRISCHSTMMKMDELERHLSPSQMEVFHGFSHANRIKVKGVPGSGKSLLAVFAASKLASQGKRVLLTCYNKALATYLDSILANKANLTVVSYHALCLRMGMQAGIRIPGGWNNNVWDKKFPKVLESAMQKDPSLKFDSIIVDDAQDFKDNWWQSLSHCLKDLENGQIFYFMDENYLLAGDKESLPEPQLTYQLCENIRTPKTLLPFLMAGYQSKLSMVTRSGYGVVPEFFNCESRQDLRLTISHLFDELVDSNGISPQEIAILTPRLTKHSQAYGCSTKNNGRLVVRFSPTSNHAMLSRVETFKGLERKCIVLVDLDEEFSQLDKIAKLRCLYLAASRCKERFIMVGNQEGWRAIQELIQNSSTTSGAISGMHERLHQGTGSQFQL